MSMFLKIDLRPSRYCTVGLALLHAGAFLSLLFSGAPFWLVPAGSAFCLYSAWHTLRTYAQRSAPGAIVECRWIEKEIWLLTDRQNKQYTAFLLGSSWRSRALLILRFALHAQKDVKKTAIQKIRSLFSVRTVLILEERLEPTVWRRLQVHLSVQRL